MEVSRGCPYHCTFCAKDNFRDRYRRRPLATILDELDGFLEHLARAHREVPAVTPYMKPIEAHIERTIGPIAQVFHEIISESIHLDLYIVPPTGKGCADSPSARRRARPGASIAPSTSSLRRRA